MKKILHIIESLGVGGAEKLLVAVINGLEGYEHHLIILDGPEALRSAIRKPCHFLNLGIQSKTGILKGSRIVRRYIREHGIDIVHSHLYKANILARLATPRKVPLFNSIHAISSLAAYDGNRMILYIERLTYRKRHHIIAVSEEVLLDFKKHVDVRGPSSVLYNFIDDSFFAGGTKKIFSPGMLRLVAVGNLRHQKNYPYLLESFKALPPGVSLDIYGEGIMRDELQQEIDRHGLNIRLCGLREDLNTVLSTYDAFVMSSFFEGQPLSLLEAMAVGLPSLLADIPVLREVGGDNAIYFNIADPETFRIQVKKILAGEIDLAAISAAAYNRVNEFAHRHQYIEKLDAMYRHP